MLGDETRAPRPFLTARWRHVAMLNYEAEASTVGRFVPRGTELDLFEGNCLVSVVGFLFQETRVFGVPIPFHTNFEELNLRFYVRKQTASGWRRGVVFVREIVPRVAVAFVARVFYQEKYVALPMHHELSFSEDRALRKVVYGGRFQGRPFRLAVSLASEFAPFSAGSVEEFLTEHYFGYCAQRDGGTREYEVQHPPWTLAPAASATLEGSLEALYGEPWAGYLRGAPRTAFVAEGSPVRVFPGRRI